MELWSRISYCEKLDKPHGKKNHNLKTAEPKKGLFGQGTSIPIKPWPQGIATPIRRKMTRLYAEYWVGRGGTCVWNAVKSPRCVVVDCFAVICRRINRINRCFQSHMWQPIRGPNILPNAIPPYPWLLPPRPNFKSHSSGPQTRASPWRFGLGTIDWHFTVSPVWSITAAIKFNLKINVVGVFILSGTVYNAKISGFLKRIFVYQGLSLA